MSNLAFFVFTMNIGDVIFLLISGCLVILVSSFWIMDKIDKWKERSNWTKDDSCKNDMKNPNE